MHTHRALVQWGPICLAITIGFCSCRLLGSSAQTPKQWAGQDPAKIGARDAPSLTGAVTLQLTGADGTSEFTFKPLESYPSSWPSFLRVISNDHDLVLDGTVVSAPPEQARAYSQMLSFITSRDPVKIVYCLEDKLFDNRFVCDSGRIDPWFGLEGINKAGYEGTAESLEPHRKVLIIVNKIEPSAYANTSISAVASVYWIRLMYGN